MGAGSASRMSAPSPRPNAFLATGDYLLSKLDVGFGTFTMNVVEQNWLPMAGRFRQPDVPGDDGLEYLCAEKASEVCGHLAGERSAVVIHRQRNALDGQIWIQGSADSHQRVQQFRYALERQ